MIRYDRKVDALSWRGDVSPVNASKNSLSLRRRVACACDPALNLTIGLDGNVDREVACCAKCGKVTASQLLTRHVHHNTFEPYDREEIALTPEVAAWLDLWPRLVTTERDEPLYFSHEFRCPTARELFERVAAARMAQLVLPRGRRMRQAGLPSTPPPTLPDALSDFSYVWEVAQAGPDRDPQRLLDCADPRFALSSALAIDSLLQRRDLPELLVDAVERGSHYRRMTACAVANEDLNIRAIILPPLLHWVENVFIEPGSGCEAWHVSAVLDTFKQWKPAPEIAAASLERAAQRIGRRDYELVRKITEVLRVIRGESPLPISTTPWFFN